MKQWIVGKTASAVSLTLALGAVAPQVVHADYAEKVEGGTVVMRHTLKGALGHTYRISREKAVRIGALADSSAQDTRRESVAGFRVETDAAGRQWVYRHPTLKGAVGAGWLRVPLKEAK